MKFFINIVIFQVAWVICILGGAHGLPLAGVVVVAMAVAYHLYSAQDARAEATLIVIAAIVGAVWESLLVAAGLLVYPSGTLMAGTAPYWIVAMWVGFATTFNVSLRWFKQHLLFAALFGAAGGPLAFLAGERFDGVVFTDYPLALGVLALGWAFLMPAMLVMAQRYNGFGEPSASKPAIVGWEN